MDPNDFYNLKIKKAKQFGFPEPIFINAEKITAKTRVIYLVEVQATHILDSNTGKTHHYALKFTKYRKIQVEPFWENTDSGFSITDKGSIEKLAAYIKANQHLLNIDILSKDYTSAILTSDDAGITVLRQILSSSINKDIIFELFKEKYP